jgi:hypothetical protein
MCGNTQKKSEKMMPLFFFSHSLPLALPFSVRLFCVALFAVALEWSTAQHYLAVLNILIRFLALY